MGTYRTGIKIRYLCVVNIYSLNSIFRQLISLAGGIRAANAGDSDGNAERRRPFVAYSSHVSKSRKPGVFLLRKRNANDLMSVVVYKVISRLFACRVRKVT